MFTIGFQEVKNVKLFTYATKHTLTKTNATGHLSDLKMNAFFIYSIIEGSS